jgi:sugar/nucleoside kinase (ribokinase family)
LTHGVKDPDRALALANAAGAVATTQAGAVTALTGPDALRQFHDDIPWLS